ncbi:hypothetical protein GF362_07275 [Candidatus Dojkabacteria bacterium]|nr:hypothetical protein [Candidatus Dojkabacteria bacterium]
MKNSEKSKKNKINAEQFFSQHKISVEDKSSSAFESFFESLRDKLNSSYLSKISSSNTMDKKKSLFSPQLLFGGGFLVAIIAALLILSPTLVKNRTLGGEIIYVEGNVEYQTPEGGWYEAEEYTSLAEGSAVRVLDQGKAIINLDDGSVLRLNSDSQISLDSMDPNSIEINNHKGIVYSRIVESERKFVVNVAGRQIESLGTSYKTINIDEKKGVRVYQNKVKVHNQEGEEEAIVKEGNKYYFEHNTNPDATDKVLEMTVEEIKRDDFILWNKELDEKIDEFKDEMGVLAELDTKSEPNQTPTEKPTEEVTEKPTETPSPTAKPTTEITKKIALSAKTGTDGIKFTWSVSGIDTSKGFKIVRSTSTSTPVYPGNDYYYITDPNARSYYAKLQDGKTYYVRICQYLGGSCGLYSNTIKVTAPTYVKPTEQPTNSVSSISLSGSGTNFSWTADGYSEKGFKLVWSKNSNPTYPTRSGDYYQYYSSPDATSGTISAKDGSGTYYVRVCEYLGGSCGIYSNQVTVTL